MWEALGEGRGMRVGWELRLTLLNVVELQDCTVVPSLPLTSSAEGCHLSGWQVLWPGVGSCDPLPDSWKRVLLSELRWWPRARPI